eukprot:TRINITY_DN14311_c0_g1_i1.p1 TRINITY_DN14311_c0_g1~~TRINITY_DN14311_c0_g1_i1.p1  ORF type:complete len:392 (-),score=47.04 TRINITY_DN14311_c0_g1_i1:25-1200(-)
MKRQALRAFRELLRRSRRIDANIAAKTLIWRPFPLLSLTQYPELARDDEIISSMVGLNNFYTAFLGGSRKMFYNPIKNKSLTALIKSQYRKNADMIGSKQKRQIKLAENGRYELQYFLDLSDRIGIPAVSMKEQYGKNDQESGASDLANDAHQTNVSVGTTLLSHPLMLTTYFSHSALLLTQYSSVEPPCALMMNMPLGYTVGDLLPVRNDFNRKLYDIFEPFFGQPMQEGGPVQQQVFWHHPYDPSVIPRSRKILDGVYWDGDLSGADRDKIDTNLFKFYAGCCTWDRASNQLEKELLDGLWITVPDLPKDLIFEKFPQTSNPTEIEDARLNFWGKCMLQLGTQFHGLAHFSKSGVNKQLQRELVARNAAVGRIQRDGLESIWKTPETQK